MIEILTSVLADNPVISSALAGEKAPMNGLALAIDISAFTENSVFAEHIRKLALSIKSLPPATSVNEILLPGERGFRQAQTSAINGIELAQGTKAGLWSWQGGLTWRPQSFCNRQYVNEVELNYDTSNAR